MDKNKKLSEELLKMDGINPTNITETDREMFTAMLDKEVKRIGNFPLRMLAVAVIFILAMFGLCMSEQILTKLHIPFVVGGTVVIIGAYAAMFFVFGKHYKYMKKNRSRIEKLHFLVHGKYKGYPFVYKKNGKRCISWISVILVTVFVWWLAATIGKGLYYLISGLWTSLPSPGFYLVFSTIGSLAFVAGMLYYGLKVPLEKLEEIEPNDFTLRRSKLSFAAIAIIIAVVSISIYFSGGSIDGASIAFAKALRNADNMPWVHMVSKAKIIKENSPLASAGSDSEQWFNISSKIVIHIYGRVVHYSDFTNKINYTYRPNENKLLISTIPTTWEESVKYKSNSDFLSTLLQLPEQFTGNITRKTGQYQNKKVDIYQINASIDLHADNSHPESNVAFEAAFEAFVDPATDLIIVVFEKIKDLSGEHIGDLEITFSYPETGPKDIYELGVPETAEVVNYLNQSQE